MSARRCPFRISASTRTPRGDAPSGRLRSRTSRSSIRFEGRCRGTATARRRSDGRRRGRGVRSRTRRTGRRRAPLRAAQITPHRDQAQDRAVPLDTPEEVVRREEHQVAAEVAKAHHETELARGHVLVVAGEDDEVVRPAQPPRVRDALEVGLGQVVHRSLVPGQPMQERRSYDLNRSGTPRSRNGRASRRFRLSCLRTRCPRLRRRRRPGSCRPAR